MGFQKHKDLSGVIDIENHWTDGHYITDDNDYVVAYVKDKATADLLIASLEGGKRFTVELPDAYDPDAPEQQVIVDCNDSEIWISATGYGDAGSVPGYGEIIAIEQYHGSLRVIVWNDINEEEPTIIPLGNAKESNRKEE
jgi:hypothetical protein